VQNDVLRDLLEKFTGQIALFSVETAHFQSGVLQSLESIVRLCETFSAPIYSDTSAAVGKLPFHFLDSGLDFAVVSGARLGALPGSGILLVQDPSRFTPLLYHGPNGCAPGAASRDVLAAETLAAALEDLPGSVASFGRIAPHRDRFETRMKQAYPRLFIAGNENPRLPNTTLLAHPGIHGQALQIELESRGVLAGFPPGRSENEIAVPFFLRSMDVPEEIARSAVSISIDPGGAEKEYAAIEHALKGALNRLLEIGKNAFPAS
jgi:cysteine desulfurase